MSKEFKENELIIYQNGDRFEIGRIKRLTEDGAFVYYHSGDTAAKTPFDCMHKLINNYCIVKTTLYGDKGRKGDKMIDLCKLFGVKELEEFKIGTHENPYRIYNNSLQHLSTNTERWNESCIAFNYVISSKITKLPKRKEFTDDELAIMRSIPKMYRWIARDKAGSVYIFEKKPSKNEYGCWGNNKGIYCILVIFNHLFKCIQWEDEEPVYIPDYVERGVE